MQPRDEFSVCRQQNNPALVDRNCPSSLFDHHVTLLLTSLPGYLGHGEVDGADGGDLGVQEVVEEGVQVTGLECLRGRPVTEDGPADRQLPGEAAQLRQIQRGHKPGEEWPRVANTVHGHLRDTSERSGVIHIY